MVRTTSILPALLGLAAASPTPGLLSTLLSNAKGFNSPFSSTSAGGKASCVSGTVAVKASAQNTKLLLSNPPSQYNDTEIFVEFLQPTSGIQAAVNGGKTTVSGTYNINAKLCFPASVSSTSSISTVHFLIHGINFDQLYWDIPSSNGVSYSYLDAAASAGYATFSFDRLGTGFSDHPDPIQTVQSALEVEIAHQMIQSLRSGSIGGTAFSHVVGIGHSYGSIQSIGLANKYPSDLDAIILQGFTINTANLGTTIADFNPTIASNNAPLRFGSLPSGYNVINSAIGDQTAFYRFPNFDTSLFNTLDGKKQTFTLGEIFTLTEPVAPAAAYTGPVDIVNGQNDFIFCSSDCTGENEMVQPALFPAAAAGSTNYYAPGTGHALNAHKTAKDTYAQMIKFSKDNGF
ncbi:hypothetical protein LTS18_014183 [Coniosporium uncinatum]|uniref:Uncharacterized protein n=1 Tax=Coniosporium uncinatum TaxID=93489 RepID=A0ACC3DCU3_9PEZI|nr:hypothetical protein LTS18_014183 [Coniosporium uncinatum]